MLNKVREKCYLHSESKISPAMICWRNNKGTSSGVTYPYLHSLVNNNSDQMNIKDKETMLQRCFPSLKKK